MVIRGYRRWLIIVSNQITGVRYTGLDSFARLLCVNRRRCTSRKAAMLVWLMERESFPIKKRAA